jgi:hypothetical protein
MRTMGLPQQGHFTLWGVGGDGVASLPCAVMGCSVPMSTALPLKSMTLSRVFFAAG